MGEREAMKAEGKAVDGEGKPKRSRRGGKRHHKEVVLSKFAKKSAQNLKANDKFREKLKGIDHQCKVWIGGLPGDITVKQLMEHFKTVGKPKVTDIRKKGTACMAFASEDDALSAVSSLNGSELKGKTIEVDEWTKPERAKKDKSEKD